MAKLTDASLDTVPTPLRSAAEQLERLASSTDGAALSQESWDAVAAAGKVLADGLRSEDLRTALGTTALLPAVGKLLASAVRADEAEGELVAARTELARVVGNMCYEHDPNRQQALDASVPLLLAEGLSETLGLLEEGEKVEQQRVLSVEELKLVRATVGALMNMSLKFDPVRRELATAPILRPLLALLDTRPYAGKTTAPIYSVGCWVGEPVGDVVEWEERLQIGQMVVGWVVNVLEDVLGESKADFPPSGILSLSSALLSIYTHPTPPPSHPAHNSAEDASDFLDTDIELLSVSSALLEGIVQASDEAKAELAFSTFNPSLAYPDSSLLEHLLAFIHSAAPPPYWAHSLSPDTEEDTAAGLARTEKAFSTIKAAVVRAVVDAPNSDEVMERLWRETKVRKEGEEGEGRSWLVEKLVLWLEEAQGQGREDMLICAAHMLAGLGRKDEHTLSLVRDYGLAGPLARIVRERVEQQLAAPGERGRPGETTQILFGVVSLLRHLAIPDKNHQVVGETGIIAPVSQFLRKELDIVGPLQLSTIGLLKHLATNNVPNALQLLAVPSSPGSSSSGPVLAPLDHILALASRTDDVRLRSEAARVVVRLVLTLSAQRQSDSSPAPEKREDEEEVARHEGWEKLRRNEDVVRVLSELVRLSGKYPVLVNEGLVALTMLAGGGKDSAHLVLSALLAFRSSPSPPPAADPSNPQPPDTPTSAAALLASWLALIPASPAAFLTPPSSSTPVPNSTVQPAMLSNAAALLLLLLEASPAADEREKLKQALGEEVRRAKEVLWVAEERVGVLGRVLGTVEGLLEGR
ncbi:hypothetical protein JCM8097_008283 [Rhodosporidiobolus ruineniae]